MTRRSSVQDRPRCATCRHPGFQIVGPELDGRPVFRCDKCASTWTNGHLGEPYWSAAQNVARFVSFGDVARDQLGMQCQYAARYVGGRHGATNLSEHLRIVGRPEDYHDLRIHEADIAEFVHRVREHRRGAPAS